MTLPEEGTLLRIFIGETDKHEGMPLYEWIVQEARKKGLAGATVFRGLEGFGAHSRIKRSKVMSLSTDLPIVIEMVDAHSKIADFIPILDKVVTEGLVTEEKVRIHFYRSGG